ARQLAARITAKGRPDSQDKRKVWAPARVFESDGRRGAARLPPPFLECRLAPMFDSGPSTSWRRGGDAGARHRPHPAIMKHGERPATGAPAPGPAPQADTQRDYVT